MEGASPRPPKRAASSVLSGNWQLKMIQAAAEKARLHPRPRRSYKDGVKLMARPFLDDRLMDCDSHDATEDTRPGRSSQQAEPDNSTLQDTNPTDTNPKDAKSENSQPCLPQIKPQDFQLPRLRRCPFDLSTTTFVGPLHDRSDSQTWRLQRVDEALMDRDGGQDGHNFKFRFKDGRLGVLKLFWDQAPPEPPSYFALQRECQNAAVLQMMQAALARTDNVGPVLVRPEPPSWDVALDNMRAFSDEYRQRNAHAQAAAADGAPSERMKQPTWMPRIRQCYGWTYMTGKSLYKLLPRACWPAPLVLDGRIRELRRDMTYTALVYEYVEEAPNDEAALEDTLAFYRDAGFSHTPRSLEKNWTANVLLDSSDLVAACGWDWVHWHMTAKSILHAT